MTQNATRSPRFLLLMRDDLRHAIEEAAATNGRTLTAEINTRLRESLAPKHGPTLTAILAREKERALSGVAPDQKPPPNTLHDENPLWARPPGQLQPTESAMLTIFRAMPPEKQLALLSLFK